MSRHAFIDESTRGSKYLICAATISPTDLGTVRRELVAMRSRGQRRLHFSSESDQRRRSLLKKIATLDTETIIYVADHPNQIAARNAIVTTAVTQLHRSGVTRFVLEAREGQDHRDRQTIYQALGPNPNPAVTYDHHTATSEPLLWVPDAVAWAWGKGGHWRRRVTDLGLVAAINTVQVS